MSFGWQDYRPAGGHENLIDFTFDKMGSTNMKKTDRKKLVIKDCLIF